jgi:cytochrome c oxidase cbb3-type subunit IV
MTLIRSLITVSLFLCFIALWVWAWRSERRTDFTAAARLPLEGDGEAQRGEST